MQGQAIVIDTNVVLDLLLYQNPLATPLHQAIQAQRVQPLATQRMLDELLRVLHYPHIAKRLLSHGLDPQTLLQTWAAQVQVLPAAPRCAYVCKDTDDQMFIDLAAQHVCPLISKDKQVLKLRKRLQTIGVQVLSALAVTDLPTSHQPGDTAQTRGGVAP